MSPDPHRANFEKDSFSTSHSEWQRNSVRINMCFSYLVSKPTRPTKPGKPSGMWRQKGKPYSNVKYTYTFFKRNIFNNGPYIRLLCILIDLELLIEHNGWRTNRDRQVVARALYGIILQPAVLF